MRPGLAATDHRPRNDTVAGWHRAVSCGETAVVRTLALSFNLSMPQKLNLDDAWGTSFQLPTLLDTPYPAHEHRAALRIQVSQNVDDQPALLILPPAVYVKNTGTQRGRGAFAGRAFRMGELVEACPVVLFDPLPSGELPLEIRRIVFGWGKLLGLPRRRPAIVLGYGSIYNHSNPAGMRCEADATNSILRFVAIRDIEADEELTINYNCIDSGVSSDDIWFKETGVTRIDS